MLFFDYSITTLELPGETCLTFFITECQNRCADCHSPELWQPVGTKLNECFNPLIQLYRKKISGVCFLGESKNTAKEHAEFADLCQTARAFGLKTCFYSGRDCQIENWMFCFDFVKIGSYKKEYGPIIERMTNQRMYKISNGHYSDVTKLFWHEQNQF